MLWGAKKTKEKPRKMTMTRGLGDKEWWRGMEEMGCAGEIFEI